MIETAVRAIKHAKKYVHDVEFYAEDASRSARDFLVDIITKVIDAGATVVNIPDTVGYSTPWQYGDLIAHLVNNVRNIDRAIISIHCHNDLGMATANSWLASGLEHRSWKAPSTASAAGWQYFTRGSNHGHLQPEGPLWGGCQYQHPGDCSYQPFGFTHHRVAVPNHKAIVGANAFMHASGIHQDGVLKQRDTYEIGPRSGGLPAQHDRAQRVPGAMP